MFSLCDTSIVSVTTVISGELHNFRDLRFLFLNVHPHADIIFTDDYLCPFLVKWRAVEETEL